MGRVFTFDEIKTDTIPRLRDFPELVDVVRRELDESLVVQGAILHGSVFRGDHSIRSDVDVLMLYEPGREGEIVDLQQELQSEAKSLAIPLRLIAVDVDMARAGDHDLSPMYLEHLARAASRGKCIKENPLDFVQPLPISYRQDLHQYLTGKRDAFNHALELLRVMSEEKRADALGKALSFPVYVARKMLQYANPTALENGGDGKARVLSLYSSLRIERGSEILAEMQKMNVMYDVALRHQRDTLNRRSYEMTLRLLECMLYLAFEFAKINLVALRTLEQG